MRKIDGKRHEGFCFTAGITKHHTLIPGTGIPIILFHAGLTFQAPVHPQCNIGRLTVQRNNHTAGASIKTILCTIIPNLTDGIPNDGLNIHITVSRDFAHNKDKSRCASTFTGNARFRIKLQNRV